MRLTNPVSPPTFPAKAKPETHSTPTPKTQTSGTIRVDPDLEGWGNAFKPSGEQTTGDWLERKADQCVFFLGLASSFFHRLSFFVLYFLFRLQPLLRDGVRGIDVNRTGSRIEPNKSYTQKAVDAITPGNQAHSAGDNHGVGHDGQGGQGIADQVAGMAQGAKDSVMGMFTTDPEHKKLSGVDGLYD